MTGVDASASENDSVDERLFPKRFVNGGAVECEDAERLDG